MSRPGTRFTFGPIVMVALIMAATLPEAYANVARVEFSIGKVVGVDGNGTQRRLVKGSKLNAGDTVQTGRGRAQIRFTDGGYTSLQPNTEFRIDEYHYDAKKVEKSISFFSLLKGGLRTITGIVGKLRKNAYQLRTPVATVGIRGTEYLAVLGNSLTVHVGDGAIDVCSNAGCSSFGAHQTGYVASANSLAVLADHPPSLAPPQERQVYAYNGGYQSQFDAGAEFSAGDSPLSASGQLPDGQLYALAVSWGENTSNADLFATGAPGALTDARFDSSGGLVEYLNSGGRVVIKGDSGSTQIGDVGSADGTVGWGRWATGSATVGSDASGSVPVNLTGASSHHYAIGMPTPVMPTNPATYSLLGATSPTLASGAGSPGTLHSADMLADFGMGLVTLNMDMTVNGTNYVTTNLPMFIGGAQGDSTFAGGAFATGNSSNCIEGCRTDVEGFFAGDDGSHAGLAYKTNIFNDYINGAGVFKKDAGSPPMEEYPYPPVESLVPF